MDGKTEHVSRMVLDYLQKNPEAGDTLEGITDWWLEMDRVESLEAEIADTLDYLVRKDVLVARKIEGGSTLFKMKHSQSDSLKL